MAVVTVTPKEVAPLAGCKTITGIAGENMDVGDVVQIQIDGAWDMANSTSAAGAAGLLGLVLSGSRSAASGAIVAGETISILQWGRVYLGASTNQAVGIPLFVAETDGAMDNAVPTNDRVLGYMDSPDTLTFNPDATPSDS